MLSVRHQYQWARNYADTETDTCTGLYFFIDSSYAFACDHPLIAGE